VSCLVAGGISYLITKVYNLSLLNKCQYFDQGRIQGNWYYYEWFNILNKWTFFISF